MIVLFRGSKSLGRTAPPTTIQPERLGGSRRRGYYAESAGGYGRENQKLGSYLTECKTEPDVEFKVMFQR